MNNSIRDVVLWNTGWWGMYGVATLQETSAKVFCAVASLIIYFIIRYKWKVD